MVGGSSRIPKLKRMLKDKFPNAQIKDDLNPETLVATGATIMAGIKSGHEPIDIILSDVTPMTYGISLKHDK